MEQKNNYKVPNKKRYKINIKTNLKEVNFLDISFNLHNINKVVDKEKALTPTLRGSKLVSNQKIYSAQCLQNQKWETKQRQSQ